MRALICELAREVSPYVHECADGECALELFATLHPDVVLMDIGLGVMNGIEATAAIRRLDPGAHVIMVTERDGSDYRRAAADAGARGFVLKEALTEIPALLAGVSHNPSKGTS